MGILLYQIFAEDQIEHYAVEGAVGQTPNRMDDIIKTQQDGGRPSEDFIMFSSIIIMPAKHNI